MEKCIAIHRGGYVGRARVYQSIQLRPCLGISFVYIPFSVLHPGYEMNNNTPLESASVVYSPLQDLRKQVQELVRDMEDHRAVVYGKQALEVIQCFCDQVKQGSLLQRLSHNDARQGFAYRFVFKPSFVIESIQHADTIAEFATDLLRGLGYVLYISSVRTHPVTNLPLPDGEYKVLVDVV